MEKFKFGLEWFLNPNHLPFLVGIDNGWFAKQGLAVEMAEPEEHFDALNEIDAGHMVLAVTEPLHLVQDRLNNKDVIGISRFLQSDSGAMFLKNKGIERPRDMIGKRVTYPSAPGPTGLAFIKSLVEADGGKCEVADFMPVNNGFYHTDALFDDLADVAFSVQQHHEMIEARQRGSDPGFFSLKDWGLPAGGSLIIITSQRLIKERSLEISRFLGVLKRSNEFIQKNPEAAKEIYYRFTGKDQKNPIEAAIMEATLKSFTIDFSMPSSYFDHLQKWLKDSKLIDSSLEPAAYWTNEFTEKTKRERAKMDIKDQVVLVTGASRGLGAEIAKAFGREGARVIVNYHQSEEKARQVTEQIGGRAIAIQADVTDRNQVKELFAQAENRFGQPVTTVINNALVNFKFDAVNRKTAEQITWEDYQTQLEGSVKASLLTTQAAYEGMSKLNFGRIIMIGTNLVQNPVVPYHDYNTSKAALIGFTRTMARELGAKGITVNMVSGGLLQKTDASASTPDEVFQLIKESTPLKRVTAPAELADATLFFASPWSRAVTGQNLVVDGGLVMN